MLASMMGMVTASLSGAKYAVIDDTTVENFTSE